MKKRYIVLLQEANNEFDDKFVKDFLDKHGIRWWHWFSHSWILTDPSGKLTAKDVSEGVIQIYKNKNNLVIELSESGNTWYGYGPADSENKDYFTWLRQYWSK